MSDNSNSIDPFPDTTKNLHVICWAWVWFVHCTVSFNTIHFPLLCHNSSSVALRNEFLNIFNGIRLPLLSVSILYAILCLLCFLLASSLVIITDITVLKLSDLVCILHMTIITSSFFDAKAPPFTCLWLKIQHASNWPPMNACSLTHFELTSY